MSKQPCFSYPMGIVSAKSVKFKCGTGLRGAKARTERLQGELQPRCIAPTAVRVVAVPAGELVRPVAV